jgi:hypothetical protein
MYSHISNVVFIKQNRKRVIIHTDMPNWLAVKLKADFEFY